MGALRTRAFIASPPYSASKKPLAAGTSWLSSSLMIPEYYPCQMLLRRMELMATLTNLLIIDQRTVVRPLRKRTRIPSEQQLFLLKLLLDSSDPLHGYDMMKSSDLGPGTLYGLLKKLFDEGHLHRHSEIIQGRCRISYQLTDKGLHYAKRALLEAELERGIAGVSE